MNLKLNLNGFTPKQYAVLIMKEDLGYSYGKIAIRLECSRYAAVELHRRAKHKTYINNES
jgi:DNA-directed RNA polymerase specialized sigma24 family protein